MAVDAGTIYSEVRIQLDKLNGDVKKIEARLDQFANKNKQQSQQVKQSWRDSFKNISLAGVVAFAAIGLAVKQAIDIFSKYEQSMANVQSVTDATAEDFKLLEDAAISAGESTRFTASQAADALYFLASAGLDAKQSINALQGVLQLAGATGADLAFTSATMAATLSQFSLNAEESTRVSNVFSSAISNSQANMEKLAGALKQVGPISGALDISLEETVASLEALFNAGFAGQQAGTGLRNILLDLSDASGPVVKQLEALGVAFDKVNPREVGLTAAIDELAKSGVDLGTIFGKRVAAQILVLAKTGGDALQELEAEITNTNSAAEMYAIQNDTLAGSMDFLKSAMESMAIKMVEELSPGLRGVVDATTEAVKWFNGLPGPVKTAIGIFAIGTPVVAGLAIAIQTLGAALSGIGGPILIVVGALATLTGVIAGVVKAQEDFNNRFEISASAINTQRTKINTLLESYDTLKEESEDNVEAQEELKKVIGELALLLPDATIEFDEYGNAIGIAREEAGKFSEELAKVEVSALEKALRLRQDELHALEQNIDSTKDLIEVDQTRLIELKALRAAEEDAFSNRALELAEEIFLLETANRQRQEGALNLESQINRMEQYEAKVLEITKIEADLQTARLAADPELRAAEEERLRAIEELAKAEENDAILAEARQRERERLAQEELERQKEIAEIREDFRRENLTEEERDLEDLETRRIELAEAGIDTEEWYRSQLAAIREKYKDEDGDGVGGDEDAQAEATERLNRVKEQYIQKLEKIGKTTIELIEIERQRATEEIQNSEATIEAKQEAIDAVNEYYDLLVDNTANEIFKNNLETVALSVLDVFQNMTNVISQLSAAMTQQRLNELDERLQAELEAAGLLEQTEIERLQTELDAAIKSGDEERAEEIRQDIERLKIQQEYEKEKAKIVYKGELAAYKFKLAGAIAALPGAIINAMKTGYGAGFPVGLFLGPFLAASAAAAGGIQIAAIRKSKPPPPSFQTGGIVIPSGADGTEVNVAENGAAELLLNGGAEGEAFLNQFAQRIADIVNTGAGGKLQIQLYIDGKKVAESSAKYYNNHIVRVDL